MAGGRGLGGRAGGREALAGVAKLANRFLTTQQVGFLLGYLGIAGLVAKGSGQPATLVVGKV